VMAVAKSKGKEVTSEMSKEAIILAILE